MPVDDEVVRASRGRGRRAEFTAANRSMVEEDRITLTSVGVDIGSSTSQLIFSELEVERVDDRYVTTGRRVLFHSQVVLTPYAGDSEIDGNALGRFVAAQYVRAGMNRRDVDTGALILTGLALQRRNAKAIAEVFAEEAGRLVAVSAGDHLEATMAAHGSGAVDLSASGDQVINIDVGGGTTKVAVCRQGGVAEVMALDVGSRLVVYDEDGVVVRLEDTARELAGRAGVDLRLGRRANPEDLRSIVRLMVDALIGEVAVGAESAASPLLRTAPLARRGEPYRITFTGGVSEYVYSRTEQEFGDLGPLLAQELTARQEELGAPIERTGAGLHATVIGASQYSTQLSGSTIYVAPVNTLPLRNVAVIAPVYRWDEPLSRADVTDAVQHTLKLHDLNEGDEPVAVGVDWRGSATFDRIEAFCLGLMDALTPHIQAGHPVVLVCDSDIGGLLGLHLSEETRLDVPVVSIDGVEVGAFDHIDVGALLPACGAVPVVIKSLVFPRPGEQR